MIIELLVYMFAIFLGAYYFFVLLLANDVVNVIRASAILMLIGLFIRGK